MTVTLTTCTPYVRSHSTTIIPIYTSSNAWYSYHAFPHSRESKTHRDFDIGAKAVNKTLKLSWSFQCLPCKENETKKRVARLQADRRQTACSWHCSILGVPGTRYTGIRTNTASTCECVYDWYFLKSGAMCYICVFYIRIQYETYAQI